MPKKGLKLLSPPAAVLSFVAISVTIFWRSAFATRFAPVRYRRRSILHALLLADRVEIDKRPELHQFRFDLDQQLVERGVIRHGSVDVAGETDGRELSMPILRHLLRDRDGLDEPSDTAFSEGS